MTEAKVNVFFYGSFMNPEVLAEVDIVPDQFELARLWGYDIQIQPLANLVPSRENSVFGIVCEVTHKELARLYGQEWVGNYLPEAVIVEVREGKLMPALCYIASSHEAKPATNAYIDRIVGPASQYGFPEWYIEKLERFRSGPKVK